jgi:hypothetical protein
VKSKANAVASSRDKRSSQNCQSSFARRKRENSESKDSEHKLLLTHLSSTQEVELISEETDKVESYKKIIKNYFV